MSLFITMVEGALGSLTFGVYWYYATRRDLDLFNKKMEDIRRKDIKDIQDTHMQDMQRLTRLIK